MNDSADQQPDQDLLLRKNAVPVPSADTGRVPIIPPAPQRSSRRRQWYLGAAGMVLGLELNRQAGVSRICGSSAESKRWPTQFE